MSWIHRYGPIVSLSLLVAVAWQFLVLPVSEWRLERLSALERALRDLDHLESTLARLTHEKTQLDRAGTVDAIWRAGQLGTVAAMIQTKIGDIAEKNDVQLRSISPIPAPDLPMVEGIGVRLESEVTLDRLVEFLVDLEYADPALVLDRASIRRLARPREAVEFPVLFVQLDLAAPIIIDEEDG